MPIRVGWEDRYCIAQNTVAITTNDSTAKSIWGATLGITGNTNGLILDEHPSINPGVNVVTTEKTTGLAEKRIGGAYEVITAKHEPSLSIGAMGLTDQKLGLFGYALFQGGVTEGATPNFTKTMIPYTYGNSVCEVWLEVGRSIGGGTDATGHVITGCIPQQLSFTGTAGERMTMGAELWGRKFRNNYNHSTATASNFAGETGSDHRFFDYTWTLAGTAANISAWDLTLSNNAARVFYNEYYTSAFMLGRITGSGSFTLAMSSTTVGDNAQIDNFIAGTDILLVGTYASHITFSLNLYYNGSEIDPAEELRLRLPYELAYDGTNHAIQISVSDQVDRLTP